MKNCIISGAIGAVCIALLIVVTIIYYAPINYAPVYLLNPEKALSYESSIVIDSLKSVHLEVLKDLEQKGVLLNPNEYTSHVASYYNTLIAFLLGLFVVLSFISVYSIKNSAKKEIDEIKADIDNHKIKTNNDLKKRITELLNELMRDSISFKESCINALYGRIEDEVLKHEDKEAIDNRIAKLEENIKFLYDAYNDLDEKKSSNQEIE